MAALESGLAGSGVSSAGGLEGPSPWKGRPCLGGLAAGSRWGAAPRGLGQQQEEGLSGQLLLEAPSRPPRGGGATSTLLCCRRKHKMDVEPEDCPASKKRLTEVGLCPPDPDSRQWVLCGGRLTSGRDQAPQCLPGTSPGLLEVPCEEMEQVAGEQQCEVARRKLQEIEARITDEDEDEDGLSEAPVGNMPTLVLSDTLKTGLKRDYTGDLTKKIIESMSRPSMELVVWKPLPAFLTKKAKTVSIKNYKPIAEEYPSESATLEGAFCLQTGQFSELQQAEMPSAFYGAVEPSGCSEEEMEL